METLKYKVIKSDAQYNKYCDLLEELTDAGSKSKVVRDEIDLLTLLIETYDNACLRFRDEDPVVLLKSLMAEHSMKSTEISHILHVSRGLVSDMLNYRKGFSKESIRILADYFKMSQEAFNRPYTLRIVMRPVKKRETSKRVKETL